MTRQRSRRGNTSQRSARQRCSAPPVSPRRHASRHAAQRENGYRRKWRAVAGPSGTMERTRSSHSRSRSTSPKRSRRSFSLGMVSTSDRWVMSNIWPNTGTATNQHKQRRAAISVPSLSVAVDAFRLEFGHRTGTVDACAYRVRAYRSIAWTVQVRPFLVLKVMSS